MTGKNATPLIGWHPKDPTLKPWIEDEAGSRGTTKSEILDEALSEYREKLDYARAVEARAVNAEISAALRGTRHDKRDATDAAS